MMGNSNLLPEGQELLNGLYTVLSYLQSANEKIREYWDLEREYQKKIKHIQNLKSENLKKIKYSPYIEHIEHIEHVEKVNVSTASEKSQYSLFVIGVTFAIIFSLLSIFRGDGSDVFYSLLIVGIFFYGKIKKKKKFFIIGAFFIVAMIIMFAVNIIDGIKYYHSIGNDVAIFVEFKVYAVGFVIAIIVSAILLKIYNSHINNKNKRIYLQNLDIDAENRQNDTKNRQSYAENRQKYAEVNDFYNQQIEEYNNYVTKKRRDLSLTINSINAEMIETTSSWYPPDYYSIKAVEKFISYLRNHRADTVKEMINTYIDSGFKKAKLKNQKEANRLLSEILAEQNISNNLLLEANTLQMGNLIANTATSYNTSTIAANTSRMVSDSDGMARKFGLNY